MKPGKRSFDPSVSDPLRDWVEVNRPYGWDEWEWHRYLCMIAMQFLQSTADKMGCDVPSVIRFVGHDDRQKPS